MPPPILWIVSTALLPKSEARPSRAHRSSPLRLMLSRHSDCSETNLEVNQELNMEDAVKRKNQFKQNGNAAFKPCRRPTQSHLGVTPYRQAQTETVSAQSCPKCAFLFSRKSSAASLVPLAPGLGSSGVSCVCGRQKRIKSSVSNVFSGFPVGVSTSGFPVGVSTSGFPVGVSTSGFPGCRPRLLFVQTPAREFSLSDCNDCHAQAVAAGAPSRNPNFARSQLCSNPGGGL